MTVEAFLFDLDGTLVDSIPDLTKSVNLLRTELDLAPISCEQVRSYVGDGVGLLLQRSLPEHLPYQSYRERFLDIYTEHLTDETEVYDGIFSFLELHRGKPMAVVTNKPQHLAVSIVARLGLSPFFSKVVGAELQLRKKPHPDMVFHALASLNSQPAATVLLGDHHVDLTAARLAGVKSCFCAWGLGHDNGLTSDFQARETSDLPKIFPGDT